jgi:pimeloyl-ACP methyl ester carboxylesterase
MSLVPDALWLNVSPAFQKLDRPLLSDLAQSRIIGQWEYSQSLDEGSSLEIAMTLLHDYLKPCDRPIHLMGHSTGGLLGLLYARRHPERVKSLTLLSVGVHPSIDWHAHYYARFQLLPCSREMILAQMVCSLFGKQPKSSIRYWIEMLERDLATSLSPHTLFQRMSIPPAGVSVPLLITGAQDDAVIDPERIQAWEPYLKAGDRLWQCERGQHFFHFFYPQIVSQQIAEFWSSVPAQCDRVFA